MKKLLDYGYVEFVEAWGSDEQVIKSARMSTDKGFLGWDAVCEHCKMSKAVDDRSADGYVCAAGHADHKWGPGDEKLLKYLWDHAHSTPFEFGGLTIEVKAPLIVFREWHRHRVPFGYSEVSARYVPLPDENYHPTFERAAMSSKTNRQASTVQGAPELTEDGYNAWMQRVIESYATAEDAYQLGLRVGVPKELARITVPVGRYSRMQATGNLRGWLGFLKLRCAPGAQYEIRVFADAVAEIVKAKFPRTYEVSRESVGMP